MALYKPNNIPKKKMKLKNINQSTNLLLLKIYHIAILLIAVQTNLQLFYWWMWGLFNISSSVAEQNCTIFKTTTILISPAFITKKIVDKISPTLKYDLEKYHQYHPFGIFDLKISPVKNITSEYTVRDSEL